MPIRQLCHYIFIILTFALFIQGCSPPGNWNKTLPSSSDLGSSRGYRIARTSIHVHSPVSYDACGGNTDCLQDLRDALCNNRVDFVFLTDHPNRMSKLEFPDLVLSKSGDTAITSSGSTIGNTISCSNSQTVIVTAGYEDTLMPIGMTQHLDTNIDTRGGLYTTNPPTAALVSSLQTTANALVFIPHTESRDNSLLNSLGMTGIEIYNLHANVNPTMRHDYLGFDHFEPGLLDVIVYGGDPYGSNQPDLAFLSFFKISPVYAQKWDYLISQGKQIVGISGNDSHQNFFPGTASDGDRVDSHRRLIRWVSNYVRVQNLTLTDEKSAISAGRVWSVFEGLGTPTGMDYYAQNGSTYAETGSTFTWVSQTTHIHVIAPSLHSDSPHGTSGPKIGIQLIKVDSTTGAETVVATSSGDSIDYVPTSKGAYRAEVSITPLHLVDFLKYKPQQARQEFKWIITNPIYLQ